MCSCVDVQKCRRVDVEMWEWQRGHLGANTLASPDNRSASGKQGKHVQRDVRGTCQACVLGVWVSSSGVNSRLFWRCLACVSWAVVFGPDDWPTIGSLVRLGFRLAPAGPLHRVRSLCDDLALLLCLATCSSLFLPSWLSSLFSLTLFCFIFCGGSLSLFFFFSSLARGLTSPPSLLSALTPLTRPRGVQRPSAWKVDKALHQTSSHECSKRGPLKL